MSGLAISLAALLAVAQPADRAAQPLPEQPAATAPKEDCRTTTPTPDKDEIIVCAERQEGYRIDPDILEANRGAKNRTRPRPSETYRSNNCGTIGPQGCTGTPTIDYITTAIVVGQMLARAAKGESVGDMFKTRPEMTEYELYQEAKRNREAREAEEAAAALAASKKASKVDAD